MVRVRFAPSPTGYLHIGGARTALFNWLFARKNKGTFVLRIEDTDEVRSTKDSVQAILDSLTWMGLDWDEGPKMNLSSREPLDVSRGQGPHAPYFQAKRAEMGMYQPFVEKLMKVGQAYHCFCSPEELEEMRKKAHLEKRPPRYDGRCRKLSEKQKKDFEAQGRKPVVRFVMPEEGVTEFEDLVHSKVCFENKLLYDFILVKASGFPTYNFACVVDDATMDVTHVIRGDDHISNTPLQVQLYQALGFGDKLPKFAHLSMILGPDGARLSKRHGATSTLEYRDQGYLPEALRNYLALLGWSTSDSQQIFEWKELQEKFDLSGCQKNPATFDPAKLLWMNGEYLRKLNPEELLSRAKPFLEPQPWFQTRSDGEVLKAVTLEREKYKLLSEVPHLVDFFFKEVEYDPEAVQKVLQAPGASDVLGNLKLDLQGAESFSEKYLEDRIRTFCKAKGYKTGQVFHPIRVAVSGRTQGPSLFAMMEVMGKEKVLSRIDSALNLIAQHS
ncbi:MAG: glutamate--tRNA ligase [Elusimicrobia bacterium]|nr:glutamate--tRNA ligase [Elusimicrobiota bacterium]